MTDVSGVGANPLSAAAVTDDRGRTRGSGGLLMSLTGSQLALSIVFGAIPSVLLALQVERAVGDDRKAGALALITTIGALAAMLTQPVVGNLSDATRTRWGSRTPWLLGGSIVAAPIVWSMGAVESLWVLGVLFVLSEMAMACAQGPLMAVMPDRVLNKTRGRFSAALGLGVMLGTVGGQAIASLLSEDLLLAYLVLGALPIVLSASRLIIDPDPDNRHVPRGAGADRTVTERDPVRLTPRAYPDFWWAFVSRLLTYTGFFTIYGYTLYILDDYVGLGEDAVNQVPIFAALAAGGVIISTVPSGLVSDRIGRRKPFVLLSSVGMGVGFAIPVLTADLSAIFAMAVVAGLAFGCYQAVDQALISQVLPRAASFGKDLGIVNVASVLPQVLAPAIAGLIVVGTGGYFALFPAGAVLAALGGLAILPVRSVR